MSVAPDMDAMKESRAQEPLHSGFPDGPKLPRYPEVRTAPGETVPSRRSRVLRVVADSEGGTVAIAVDGELLFGLWRIVLQQFLYGLCQILLLFFGFGLRIECLTRHAAPREILVRGVV